MSKHPSHSTNQIDQQKKQHQPQQQPPTHLCQFSENDLVPELCDYLLIDYRRDLINMITLSSDHQDYYKFVNF